MLTIGIDPGLDGAICACADGVPVFAAITPTLKVQAGKSTRKVFDPAGMRLALRACVAAADEANAGEYDRPDLIALELTESRPPKGRNACHSLGLSQGLWQGIIVGLGWRYITPRAADWIPAMCKGVPGKGKDRSILAAGRLLPSLSLERSARATKKHDGLAEAGLLSLYALREVRGMGDGRPI
tara:strand:- start:27621 stop:28172 length:552 start_codon:yes stop_codon:yes gene_type:complete